MLLKTTDYAKTIEAESWRALEEELDRLTDEAIQHALGKPGLGILVTRQAPGSFSIELSDKVPPGIIAELDLTTR